MQVWTNAKIVGLFVISTLQCNFCHVFAPKTQTFLVRKERKRKDSFFSCENFLIFKTTRNEPVFLGGGAQKKRSIR